jgi:hypothetical protein
MFEFMLPLRTAPLVPARFSRCLRDFALLAALAAVAASPADAGQITGAPVGAPPGAALEATPSAEADLATALQIAERRAQPPAQLADRAAYEALVRVSFDDDSSARDLGRSASSASSVVEARIQVFISPLVAPTRLN